MDGELQSQAPATGRDVASESESGSGVVARALARGRVGSLGMVSFVGACAAPLMVLAALLPTAWAVTGFVGMPMVFVIIGAVLAVFAVGYTAMARQVRNAGALYSYIAHGLGRPAGTAAAAVAVFAYNGLQVGIYGAFGAVTQGLLTDVAPGIPWWGYALAAWAVVAFCGVLRVDFSSGLVMLLLTLECGIVLVADVAMLVDPAGGQVSVAGFSPTYLAAPGLGAAIVVVATAFVGIEAPTVYAEEARHPRRSVPVATFLGIGLVGGLYALSSWALTVSVGSGRIVPAARSQGEDLLFNAISAQLGTPVGLVARVLLISSMFAGLLAFHNTVARYTFALGRERVLPAVLATVRRSGSPTSGSLVQSSLGLAVLLLYAVTGADPMRYLFFVFGTGGGLGVLLLLAATSVSIVVFFARRRTAQPAWLLRVLPVLAALGLLAGVGMALANMDVLLGVPAGSLLTWLIPTGYALIVLGGLCWALVLRRSQPATYAAIGRGADTAEPPDAPNPSESRTP